MLYDDVIAVRPVFHLCATPGAIAFRFDHYATAGGKYPGSTFHFEINCGSVIVGVRTKVTLYNEMAGIAVVRQPVHVTCVICSATILQ